MAKIDLTSMALPEQQRSLQSFLRNALFEEETKAGLEGYENGQEKRTWCS